jgi:hypothetical protein
VREGAERVNEQIKNLTRFLYLFGRISNGIETTEQLQAQERAGGGNAQLERTKSGLLDSVRNVRAGLDDLENYFESTPAVRRYYGNVVGVASAAADAEAQAVAGQYDQAGRSLIGAINKLSDALLSMR